MKKKLCFDIFACIKIHNIKAFFKNFGEERNEGTILSSSFGPKKVTKIRGLGLLCGVY